MHPRRARYGLLSWSGYWQVVAGNHPFETSSSTGGARRWFGNHVIASLPADFSLKPRSWAEVRSII
jgi:hypothetical protein